MIVNEFGQHHPCAGENVKRRSIQEYDGDLTVMAGFDQVAFVEKIANSRLSNNQLATPEGERTCYSR